MGCDRAEWKRCGRNGPRSSGWCSREHDVGDEAGRRGSLREPQVAVTERVDDALIRGGTDGRQRIGQRRAKAHPLGAAFRAQLPA